MRAAGITVERTGFVCVQGSMLYLGNEGDELTPTHFDVYENFLHVVLGCKDFILVGDSPFSRIHLPIPSALPLLQPTRSNVSEKWLPLLFVAGRVPAWIDLKCHNFVVYFF